MRLVLIADAFPPMRTSGAVQLWDLSHEFLIQGHNIVVLLPSAEIECAWAIEDMEGVRVLRLRAPRVKDVNYLRRVFGEILMPFFMWRNLCKSPLDNAQWDGIVWYSPSIFHGPLVHILKSVSRCKSYLILRDIFPQWAADIGLISKRGLTYLFLSCVARYQYFVADIIGVQSPGNLKYFNNLAIKKNQRLEVLQNWLFNYPVAECSIALASTKLSGRKIFVYAGNMGVAQGVDTFLDLAELLKMRLDLGFLFVGRGSCAEKLADDARLRGLNNVLFYAEIHPREIPGLLAQCVAGLVALDPRHVSHNIPGKFLTYMQAGLPVLAKINAGNDLVEVIRENNIGHVSVDGAVRSLMVGALELLDLINIDPDIRGRCRSLYRKEFSPERAVRQITSALLVKADVI